MSAIMIGTGNPTPRALRRHLVSTRGEMDAADDAAYDLAEYVIHLLAIVERQQAQIDRLLEAVPQAAERKTK